ncbi:MAG: peptidylprolyl isomerase [Candidatus Alcyoniella australis]|nr:peptidylprolyl isomerase [Candidatus Alcyoniella australis]
MRVKPIALLLPIVMCLGLIAMIAACEQPATTSSSSSTAPDSAGGTELAKVGTTVITFEEFNSSLERVPPYFRQRLATREGKLQHLDTLVVKELFYQEALNKGYDQDPDFLEELDMVKKTLLYNKVRNEFAKTDFAPTEDEKKAYYEEHTEEFSIPERATVRHIMTKLRRNATPEDEAAAETKIGQAQAELKGGDFAAVAEKFSEERGSASKGGLLSPIKKGSRGKEFDEAVFALQSVGEISPVFRDSRGFHIVQLEKKEPTEVRDYDSVERTIERKIINERRREQYETYITDLKGRIGVTIDENLLVDESAGEPEADAEAIPVPKSDGEIELAPVSSEEKTE